MFTYLVLNIFTISIPLARSFENRIQYYKKFKALFTAIGLTAFVFLVWDYFFTSWNVWQFNPDYLVGIYFLGMPLEEWLFFITIPYACIFIFETLNYFTNLQRFNRLAQAVTVLLILGLTIIGGWHIEKMYTSVTFLSTAAFLLVMLIWKPAFMATFYTSYLICIVPFLAVNGVLTYLPVVIYNNSENLSLRLFSIPVEDTVYMLLLLFMNVAIYEFLKGKWSSKPESE